MPTKQKRSSTISTSSSSLIETLKFVRAHALQSEWTRFVTLVLFFSFMLGTSLTLLTIDRVNAAQISKPLPPTVGSLAKDLAAMRKRVDGIESTLRDATSRLGVVEDRLAGPSSDVAEPATDATGTVDAPTPATDECPKACQEKAKINEWNAEELKSCFLQQCGVKPAPTEDRKPVGESKKENGDSREQCIANCKSGTGIKAPSADEVNRCIASQCRPVAEKPAAPSQDECRQKCADQLSTNQILESDPNFSVKLNRCMAVNCPVK